MTFKQDREDYFKTKQQYKMTDTEKRALIVEYVCRIHGTSLDEMRTQTKESHVVRARQVAWFAMSVLTSHNDERIGRYFNRSRTTVIHGKGKIANYIDIYLDYKKEVDNLINHIAQPVAA